jgi:hypothetical protein
MRSLCFGVFMLLTTSSQAQLRAFSAADQPVAPDYSQEKNWSALPFRQDAADEIPLSETWVNDSLKQADVFYIYPTIYMKGKTWNADLNNKTLNKKIDNKPIKYQATVFNNAARVYAPRYRQGILQCFYDTTGEGKKSLAFAYEDVKRAFEYYLAHYNNGRPIIIASHSQGSYHARRLLAEFFDTTALRNQLVAAYVIGYAFKEDLYKNLKPCENETQTGCYITWASYKNGFEAGETQLAGNVCVNPISWKRDTISVSSKGSILLSFNKEYDCRAQLHKNLLWVTTPMPLVKTWNNLHIADYNLFWYNIRGNARRRIDAFLSTVSK